MFLVLQHWQHTDSFGRSFLTAEGLTVEVLDTSYSCLLKENTISTNCFINLTVWFGVCRWGQEVWVECSRHQQHVLRVALAAAGGAEWPGPPECPAHLSHHCGHGGGKCCGQTSGHSCEPCRHREHPQDRQGGEKEVHTVPPRSLCILVIW